MTVNEKIIKALEPFGIPVRADFSDDDKEEYFTFNYIGDMAGSFGDDAPLNVIACMQIHYVSPIEMDPLMLKKRIRKALLENGFTYPEVTDATEKGDSIRHLIFECEIENEFEMED